MKLLRAGDHPFDGHACNVGMRPIVFHALSPGLTAPAHTCTFARVRWGGSPSLLPVFIASDEPQTQFPAAGSSTAWPTLLFCFAFRARQCRRSFNEAVGLDDVTRLKVIELFDSYAALLAGAHAFDVVLVVLQA